VDHFDGDIYVLPWSYYSFPMARIITNGNIRKYNAHDFETTMYYFNSVTRTKDYTFFGYKTYDVANENKVFQNYINKYIKDGSNRYDHTKQLSNYISEISSKYKDIYHVKYIKKGFYKLIDSIKYKFNYVEEIYSTPINWKYEYKKFMLVNQIKKELYDILVKLKFNLTYNKYKVVFGSLFFTCKMKGLCTHDPIIPSKVDLTQFFNDLLYVSKTKNKKLLINNLRKFNLQKKFKDIINKLRKYKLSDSKIQFSIKKTNNNFIYELYTSADTSADKTTSIMYKKKIQLPINIHQKLIKQYQAMKTKTMKFNVEHIILIMLIRYYCILESGNNQMSLDFNKVFGDGKIISQMELFASPLNANTKLYCSMFYDIDRYFGSYGSFYNIELHEGSYNINPPFREDIMEKMSLRLMASLHTKNTNLRYYITIPAWFKNESKAYRTLRKSKFCITNQVYKQVQFTDVINNKIFSPIPIHFISLTNNKKLLQKSSTPLSIKNE